MYNIIIEQTKEYPNRMEFDPINNNFRESKYKSLFYARNFPYPYGWIKESGTPPGPHLDIILLSTKEYNLGDELGVKIIGCFLRNDGDNKLIGILPERIETDINELSEEEKFYLYKLYPRVDDGEGWFGEVEAKEVIESYFKTKVE